MSCETATADLAAAKKKLKKLKQSGASAPAIKAAKQKVKKAQKAVDKTCGFDPVLYDVTAATGTFDATVIQDRGFTGCSPMTRDAHWTSTLGPNPGPAKLEVYYRDRKGRPAAYLFTGPPHPGIPLVTHGSGTATQTCSAPEPGSNGTVTCTFNVDHPNDSMTLHSDPEGALDPLPIEWFFGYNLFSYGPRNGGGCSFSGRNPPEISSSDYSPGLFVSPLNDEEFLLEPPGLSSEGLASFDGEFSLSFKGSASSSSADGSSLQAAWQMTVSFRRR